MLERIKAIYFVKIFLSNIEEKKKLKIIKYNKNLQTELNINLMNYKIFSGKYIKYEANGIGIEYDSYNNEILFKGEYSKGERNGKGTEYDKGKIIFNGEYLNGERNGNGKELNYKDNYMFKGEYRK